MITHYEKIICQPGSTLYYSLLPLPLEERSTIILLHAFFNELKNISEKCSTPETAFQRFQWWRGELYRLFNGTPEHPIGKALFPFIKKYSLSQTIFSELLDGMETQFLRTSYHDFLELIEDAHHTWSLLAILIAQVLQKENINHLIARELGVCWYMIHILQFFPWDMQRGRLYFPTEMLKTFQLSPEEIKKIILEKKSKVVYPQFNLFLKSFISKIKEIYDAKPNPTKDMTPLIIFTELKLATLKKLEKKGFSKKYFPLSLSPLRKAWISRKIK